MPNVLGIRPIAIVLALFVVVPLWKHAQKVGDRKAVEAPVAVAMTDSCEDAQRICAWDPSHRCCR